MKGMNYLEIAGETEKLSEMLTEGRIQQAFMPTTHELLFDVRVPGKSVWLYFSLHPRFGRIHTISAKSNVPKSPPAFCMSLRKRLVGGRIIELSALPKERIVALWVEKGEENAGLIVEIFGPAANAYLIADGESIIDVLYRKKCRARGLALGDVYLPPESRAGDLKLTARDFGSDTAAYFSDLETRYRFEREKGRLTSALNKALKRTNKYVAGLRGDLERTENPDRLRKNGELLSINIGKIKMGADEIVVQDIYEPDAPDVRIKLDPVKNPSENIEKYFKKAKKNKKKLKGLATRISEMEDFLLKLEEVSGRMEKAEKIDELEKVNDELFDLGVIRETAPGKRRTRQEPSGPHEFISADGNTIMVGRNSKQNDEITFRIAKGNDYWLHVYGSPGSHVVIRLGKNEPLKQETLLDAATLAVLHSKLSRQGYGDVIYTRRKYVSKPKGAPPGRVTHSQSKNVFIKIDKRRVDRLMGKGRPNY